MHISQQYGVNFRYLRNAAGIAWRGNSYTQNEIAKQLGVSRKTIVFWESGHIPSPEKMGLICEFFSRKLGLDDMLMPEELLEDDISRHFLLIPERGEVRRVSPEKMNMIQNIFGRIPEFTEKDLEILLEKIIELEDED